MLQLLLLLLVNMLLSEEGVLPLYKVDVSNCKKTEPECHFEAGRIIGKQAARRYFIAVQEASFQDIMSFCSTSEGNQIREKFLERANASYPEFVSELKGLALGCGQPFLTVVTLNLAKQLKSFMFDSDDWRDTAVGGDCSDIMINDEDNGIVYLAHNEDADPYIANTMHLVYAKFPGHSFIGFAEPGFLGGSTWG